MHIHNVSLYTLLFYTIYDFVLYNNALLSYKSCHEKQTLADERVLNKVIIYYASINIYTRMLEQDGWAQVQPCQCI